MDIAKLKIQFLEYLEVEKNRSPKTIENYDRYLGKFLTWAHIKEAGQINDDLIRNFRLYLNRFQDEKGRPLKKITQNYYIIALRCFLKYLAKRDIKTIQAEKVEIGKTPEREVDFLENSEVERILESASGADFKSLRDRAILELLFSAGLRVSELTNIDRDKFNLKSGELSVRGKGSKIRVVFISDSAAKAIENYLKKRTDIDPALFVRPARNATHSVAGGDAKALEKFQTKKTIGTDLASVRKKNVGARFITPKKDDLRLTPRSIQRIVKFYAAKAGIVKDVHPHTLRHSFATDLIMNGADIRSVQEMLGHSSITTTQIYTHITNPHLKEVHQTFHARRRKENK